MLTSFFLMRCSSRSSGPSKFATRTGYASRIDSNSGCSMIESDVSELDCFANALHLVLRRGPRPARSLMQDFADAGRLCEYFASPCAHRIEVRVERLRELLLHLDIADLPCPVP